MSSRERQKIMRGNAIQRVLARSMDRAAIGSLDDLRRAYEQELAAHGAEIAAEADRQLARLRAVDESFRGKLRCAACDGPITGARRFSRRYCSPRCRQRAHRQAAAAP